ncbi:SRPBCC family protein [Microbispora sp. RL4-1S]|uniref:SRPBCC family protein n=1 Tax=Microbispora oryzae TaxID=2806554 RepID=A0A940WQ19_9ACTN|nr:SRPBCC family protein [Microbispora oryzae]MBP2707852.1 SRPBCC family protein [Microbispora oryzae]
MSEDVREAPVREAGAGLPTHRLKAEFQNIATALGERALSSVTDKVDNLAGRLTNYVEHGATGGGGLLGGLASRFTGGDGGHGLLGGLVSRFTGGEGGGGHPIGAAVMAYAKEKIKGVFGGGAGGGKGGKGKKLKVTNIVEQLDIGAPIRLVYNQWTQFEDFPSFMKKVETVEQKSDEKIGWKAQVWWSHRTWESTIVEQVPDSRIIWRSQGPKGYVDGAVTFHEITPELTRVLLVLEYHPQGLFERTGNLWRAQGRRARLEFKHFRRHVMANVLLHPEEIEGWRGEIRDSKVVKDHETALREEQQGERGRAPEEAAQEEEPYEPEEAEEAGEPYEEAGAEGREEPYEEVAEGREPRRHPVRHSAIRRRRPSEEPASRSAGRRRATGDE